MAKRFKVRYADLLSRGASERAVEVFLEFLLASWRSLIGRADLFTPFNQETWSFFFQIGMESRSWRKWLGLNVTWFFPELL